MDSDDSEMMEQQQRGQIGSQVGGQAGNSIGTAIGTTYGGPVGGVIGGYLGEKIGSQVGDQLEDQTTDAASGSDGSGDGGGQEEPSKNKGGGGGCSGGTSGFGEYQAGDGKCHATPKTPYFKLEIQENNLPENWWDKLPDFDPRVYDAIAMEQAAACVKYIFDGLPEMHELEHMMEARKNRKTCPRLKTQVPRTKVIRPRELKYEVKIDSWMKKDQTY